MDQPLPTFALSELHIEEATVDDWTMLGKITLLNFFGSWCDACKTEQATLLKASKSKNIQVVGMNWRDTRGDAIAWLEGFGHAYERIGFDDENEVVDMLGVNSAPTTFIVDPRGHIRYKYVGPITARVYRKIIAPIIVQIEKEEI